MHEKDDTACHVIEGFNPAELFGKGFNLGCADLIPGGGGPKRFRFASACARQGWASRLQRGDDSPAAGERDQAFGGVCVFCLGPSDQGIAWL